MPITPIASPLRAVGPGVDPKAFKAGERIMVFHYEGCNHCDHCRTGWTQLCDHGAIVHGVMKHGGHADYMDAGSNDMTVFGEGIASSPPRRV